MSEREIRSILRDVCADLDRHSRWVVRNGVRKIVFPTVIGATLALSGCDSRSTPEYAAPLPDGQVTEAGAEGGPVYMAPDRGATPPYQAPDKGPLPPYMAPDGMVYQAPDGGPQPEYQASDAGPMPPYQAPDKGPQPDYQAP